MINLKILIVSSILKVELINDRDSISMVGNLDKICGLDYFWLFGIRKLINDQDLLGLKIDDLDLSGFLVKNI